jgi:hypothetical protein
MSVVDVLDRIWAAGIRVEACGDKLRLNPKSRATSEIVELVREHKPAILAALAASPVDQDKTAAIAEITKKFPGSSLIEVVRRGEPGSFDILRPLSPPDRQATPTDFGLCEVCGDPAGLIVPFTVAVAGKRRFCGIACCEVAYAGRQLDDDSRQSLLPDAIRAKIEEIESEARDKG